MYKFQIYLDRLDDTLDLRKILDYLEEKWLSVELRGDIFEALQIPSEKGANGLARCLIKDQRREGSLNLRPKKDEIENELEILNSQSPIRLKEDLSNVYDAFALAGFFKSYLKGGLNILITSRMFATFEKNRYHGRVIFMDFPLGVISITGIVEAPARPKEYYIKLAAYSRGKEMGLIDQDKDDFMVELKKEFQEGYIDYGDPRLTEILKGYALQAVFYLLWGEAFCESPECQLYNAHTQKELIYAQIEHGRLCERHFQILQKG